MTKPTCFWTNEFEFYSLQDEHRCNAIKTPSFQTKGLNSDNSKLTEDNKRDGKNKTTLPTERVFKPRCNVDNMPSVEVKNTDNVRILRSRQVKTNQSASKKVCHSYVSSYAFFLNTATIAFLIFFFKGCRSEKDQFGRIIA